MGIQDRDYYRRPVRGGFGDFRPWSVTTWLIIVNVAVFFLDGFLARVSASDVPFQHMRRMFIGNGPLYKWGYFSLSMAVMHGQVWRFITFQFLHASIGHIFWNMLGLFLFGQIVEGQLGARRFLGFYLSCGIAGAVSYILLWSCGVLITGPEAPMIGASAGILGVLLAAARLAPDMGINLLFPPITLTLRMLAWGYMLLAVYIVMTSGDNSGGEAAHLGGGLWGFVLIRNEWWLNFLTPRRPIARTRRRRVMFRDWSRDPNH